MPVYETIFIVNPDFSSEKQTEIIDKMLNVLKQGNAKIKKMEDWGVKRLAYQVAKLLRGRYFLICFESEPKLVWELERNFKITEGVIKYMSIVLGKEEIARLQKELGEKEGEVEIIKRADLSDEEEPPKKTSAEVEPPPEVTPEVTEPQQAPAEEQKPDLVTE